MTHPLHRRTHRSLLFGICSLCLLVSTSARADSSCSGTLASVILYNDGTVMIDGSWRNDWTYLCNTQSGWGGIDGATCLAGYAAAVKAAASPLSVGIDYTGSRYPCTNLPMYSASIVPLYLMTSH